MRERLHQGEVLRNLDLATWGLPQSWAKDGGPAPINARIETAASNGMFRSAFAGARAQVPMTGCYEWEALPDGKQPDYIHAGDELLAAAGLYAPHKDLATGEWTLSFTIITRVARDASGEALSSLPQGGYIVVGADDHGQRAGPEFAPPDPEQYDEATLRQIVNKCVEGPVRLVVGLHEVDSRPVAVIYVGPTDDALPPAMRCEGTYRLQRGDTKIGLRAGDFYLRDGASSVRMQNNNWSLLLTNFRACLIDRLVGNVHLRVLRMLDLESARALFRAEPVGEHRGDLCLQR